MIFNTIFNQAKNVVMFAVIAVAALPIAAHAGWGAISADEVIGEKDPYWGTGGGDSKNEATRESQKNCRDAGGSDCHVMVTFQQCGAYAASKKYSGTGVAANKKAAESKALAECNNSNCSVVVSDCND